MDPIRALPALPRERTPERLATLDLRGLPDDERLLFTTLQGVVNRRGAQIYLLLDSQEGAETWLRDLGAPSAPLDPWDALARYRANLRGVIVYDPAQPDSVNVALTLAGLEDALVASPSLAERLAAAPHALPILDDLRGRFTSRLDAYAWQFAQLWPRANHALLVGISPGGVRANGTFAPSSGLLQDYAVAQRALVCWLDPGEPSERALFERILAATPPNTPYLGWFPADVAGEFSGTELASAHSVYVLAADYCSNLSVFAGARPPSPAFPPAYAQPRDVTTPAPLEPLVYITVTFSEGDNLQYMQHWMRRVWDDPARGSVPLNWSVDPLALDLAPLFLDYYYRTRTANDLLIAGPSGAGYCYPDAWPDATFDVFARQSAEYMRRAGLDIAWILNRRGGESIPLSPARAGAYERELAPRGVLLNYEGVTETTLLPLAGGKLLPQAITLGVGNPTEMLLAIAASTADWDGVSPRFVSLGALAWSLTPSDIAAVAATLGPHYRFTLADEYFRLARLAME